MWKDNTTKLNLIKLNLKFYIINYILAQIYIISHRNHQSYYMFLNAILFD